MKCRLFALTLILAVSLVAWTQDTPAASTAPNSTSAPQAETCCHHNVTDMKDGKGCCHHTTADAKDAAACRGKNKCEAKDGKSCCEAKNMKAAMKECKKNDCCKDGKAAAKARAAESKGDKTAMGCCGSKCERTALTPAAS
ncbi:MAG: hypothetical protein WB566_20205 [Terriglobales bacterium]